MKLTPAQQEQYWRHRTGDMPAALAYSLAGRTLPEGYEPDSSFVYADRTARVKMHNGPFEITLDVLPDEPTEDERAEFGTLVSTSDPEAALVRLKAPEYLPTTDPAIWFKPTTGYWQHRAALSKMGIAKAVAAEKAARWGREDRDSYFQDHCSVVVVNVTVEDIQVAGSINPDVRLRPGRWLPDLMEFVIDSGVINDALATARVNLAKLRKLATDFPSSEGQTLTGGGNG